MPNYVYEPVDREGRDRETDCSRCNPLLVELQRMSDEKLTRCPGCHEPVKYNPFPGGTSFIMQDGATAANNYSGASNTPPQTSGR